MSILSRLWASFFLLDGDIYLSADFYKSVVECFLTEEYHQELDGENECKRASRLDLLINMSQLGSGRQKKEMSSMKICIGGMSFIVLKCCSDTWLPFYQT